MSKYFVVCMLQLVAGWLGLSIADAATGGQSLPQPRQRLSNLEDSCPSHLASPRNQGELAEALWCLGHTTPRSARNFWEEAQFNMPDVLDEYSGPDKDMYLAKLGLRVSRDGKTMSPSNIFDFDEPNDEDEYEDNEFNEEIDNRHAGGRDNRYSRPISRADDKDEYEDDEFNEEIDNRYAGGRDNRYSRPISRADDEDEFSEEIDNRYAGGRDNRYSRPISRADDEDEYEDDNSFTVNGRVKNPSLRG